MVKQGYKQTEIGVIPNDWESVALLSKCILLNGLTYTPDDIADTGLLVIRSSNVQNHQLVFSDNVYVDLPVADEKLIRKDDIIICVRNGSAALIGKCAKASRDYAITFGAFMAVLRGENNGYIYQLLQQGTIQKHISKNSGATINQITNGDFKTIFVPFPTDAKEQECIAEALSDVDSMISSLEKLIAKKKAVKQGAMQELLTGKKRLPGFIGEWAHMELGKYGSLMKETINPQLYSSEYFWEYSMPAFDEGRTPIKQKGADMHSNRTVICGKVLLFNKLNVRQKRIWLIDQCRDSAVCSSEFLPYKSDAINLELLSQILYTDKVTLEFIGMSTGTSNSQKRITPDAFLEYKVYLPVNEKEQAAIANVFSCMDNEIEALEQKLEKTRQIKQGMMQQLLTGKIRLV